MAIWKEIKKAINSSLSTSDFKPIDEMIKNYADIEFRTINFSFSSFSKSSKSVTVNLGEVNINKVMINSTSYINYAKIDYLQTVSYSLTQTGTSVEITATATKGNSFSNEVVPAFNASVQVVIFPEV